MKFGIRRGELGKAIGSEQLAREMIAAGWLTPMHKRHRITLYSPAAVAKAMTRIEKGERPLIKK